MKQQSSGRHRNRPWSSATVILGTHDLTGESTQSECKQATGLMQGVEATNLRMLARPHSKFSGRKEPARTSRQRPAKRSQTWRRSNKSPSVEGSLAVEANSLSERGRMSTSDYRIVYRRALKQQQLRVLDRSYRKLVPRSSRRSWMRMAWTSWKLWLRDHLHVDRWNFEGPSIAERMTDVHCRLRLIAAEV